MATPLPPGGELPRVETPSDKVGSLTLHTDSQQGSEAGEHGDLLESWEAPAPRGAGLQAPILNGHFFTANLPNAIQPGGPDASASDMLDTDSPPAGHTPARHTHPRDPIAALSGQRSSGDGSSARAAGSAGLLATIDDTWFADAARTAGSSSEATAADLAHMGSNSHSSHTASHGAAFSPESSLRQGIPAIAGRGLDAALALDTHPAATQPSEAPTSDAILTPILTPPAAHTGGSASLEDALHQLALRTRATGGRPSLDMGPDLHSQADSVSASLARLSPSGANTRSSPLGLSAGTSPSTTVMTVPASALNQILSASSSQAGGATTLSAASNAQLAAAMLQGSPLMGSSGAAGSQGLLALSAAAGGAGAQSPGGGPSKIHALYKTEMCRGWLETGICRYGAKCQFAHGPEELRPVPRHPKYKTEVCRAFALTGTCAYGARCRFIHGTPGSLTGLLSPPTGHASAPHALSQTSPAAPNSKNMAQSTLYGAAGAQGPGNGNGNGGGALTASGMLEGIHELEGMDRWAEDLFATSRASSTPPSSSNNPGGTSHSAGAAGTNAAAAANAARRLLDIRAPSPKGGPKGGKDTALARSTGLGPAGSNAAAQQAAAQQAAAQQAHRQQMQHTQLIRRSLELLGVGGGPSSGGGGGAGMGGGYTGDYQLDMQQLAMGGAGGGMSGELVDMLRSLDHALTAAAAGGMMQMPESEPSSSNMQSAWQGFMTSTSHSPADMGSLSTSSMQLLSGPGGLDLASMGSGTLQQLSHGGGTVQAIQAGSDDAVVAWLMGRGSAEGSNAQLAAAAGAQHAAAAAAAAAAGTAAGAAAGRASFDNSRGAFEGMQGPPGMQQQMPSQAGGVVGGWHMPRVPSPQLPPNLTPAQMQALAQNGNYTVPPYVMSRGSMETQAAQRASYDGGAAHRVAYDTSDVVRLSYDGVLAARQQQVAAQIGPTPPGPQQHAPQHVQTHQNQQAAQQQQHAQQAAQQQQHTQQAQQHAQQQQQAQQQQVPRHMLHLPAGVPQGSGQGRGSIDSQPRASFESARSTWDAFASVGAAEGAGMGRGAGNLPMEAIRQLRDSFWGVGGGGPGSGLEPVLEAVQDHMAHAGATRLTVSDGLYSQGDAVLERVAAPNSLTPGASGSGTARNSGEQSRGQQGLAGSHHHWAPGAGYNQQGPGGQMNTMAMSMGMGISRASSVPQPGPYGVSAMDRSAPETHPFAFPGFGSVSPQAHAQAQAQQLQLQRQLQDEGSAGLAALLAALSHTPQ